MFWELTIFRNHEIIEYMDTIQQKTLLEIIKFDVKKKKKKKILKTIKTILETRVKKMFNNSFLTIFFLTENSYI